MTTVIRKIIDEQTSEIYPLAAVVPEVDVNLSTLPVGSSPSASADVAYNGDVTFSIGLPAVNEIKSVTFAQDGTLSVETTDEQTVTFSGVKDAITAAETATNSATGAAAAANTAAQYIEDFESDNFKIAGCKKLEATNPGEYIDLVVNSITMVDGEPATTGTSATMNCWIIQCAAGDKFTINGTGGNTARLFAFADSNGLILSKAYSQMVASNLVIVAPLTSAWLIVNTGLNGICYSGELIPLALDDINNNLEASINSKYSSIINKMMLIKSDNVYDGKFIENAYIASNGAIVQNSSYVATESYIPVSEGDVVRFYGMTSGVFKNSNARFICAYDSNLMVVTGAGVDSNTQTYTVPNGVSFIRATLYKGVAHNAITINKVITGITPYFEPYYIAGDGFIDESILNNLHVYLPPEICVGVGRTIELYNDLVCLEADKYHINWQCSVGVAFARKFSVTGTESNIGTYTLTLNIYNDNMQQVKSLTSTLKIVADNLSSVKKIIPIGDSLTNLKPWLNEVQSLSSSNIAYIGTRKSSSANYAHEGRSGAQAAWYNADSTYTFDNNYVGNPNVAASSNPFYDSTSEGFSLSHYLTAQSGYVDTPDAVQLLLGTNGIATNPSANVTNIMKIVDSITSEYPTMPIFVCNTIYRSNQNGYHSTGQDGYVPVSDFQFSADIKIMNLQNALLEALADYENVYIIPLSVCMDRDNDFGQVEVPVNPRLTTVTTHIANESVHPQTPGYMQMADVMYSSYIAHL